MRFFPTSTNVVEFPSITGRSVFLRHEKWLIMIHHFFLLSKQVDDYGFVSAKGCLNQEIYCTFPPSIMFTLSLPTAKDRLRPPSNPINIHSAHVKIEWIINSSCLSWVTEFRPDPSCEAAATRDCLCDARGFLLRERPA